jgi:hypothetical protein
MMVAFDAADRSYCTVRRQSTSTPLQPLVLLNDPQFVEAARLAAERMLREGGSTRDEQLAWLFRQWTGRRPTDRERAVLVESFEEQRAIFAADEQSVAKLLAVGETPYDESLPKVDLAAACVVSSLILNHDEACQRR